MFKQQQVCPENLSFTEPFHEVSITSSSLEKQWLELHASSPRTRIRDAARELHTTEAEILASFAGGSVLRLNPLFKSILQRLPEL